MKRCFMVLVLTVVLGASPMSYCSANATESDNVAFSVSWDLLSRQQQIRYVCVLYDIRDESTVNKIVNLLTDADTSETNKMALRILINAIAGVPLSIADAIINCCSGKMAIPVH